MFFTSSLARGRPLLNRFILQRPQPLLWRPAMMRNFAVEVSSGNQKLEVTSAGGKMTSKPLYFDNQATTPIDPR